MLLELIATVTAGVGAAGIAVLLRRLSGGRFGRWIVPLAAGGAMLGVTIASEYSWYERTREQLPSGVAVAHEHESRAIYRPWTWLVPYVDRFAAVDRASIRTHPDRPERRIVKLLFYGRWSQPREALVAVDCERRLRARLSERVRFGPDGGLANVEWRQVAAEDPVQRTACSGSSG